MTRARWQTSSNILNRTGGREGKSIPKAYSTTPSSHQHTAFITELCLENREEQHSLLSGFCSLLTGRLFNLFSLRLYGATKSTSVPLMVFVNAPALVWNAVHLYLRDVYDTNSRNPRTLLCKYVPHCAVFISRATGHQRYQERPPHEPPAFCVSAAVYHQMVQRSVTGGGKHPILTHQSVLGARSRFFCACNGRRPFVPEFLPTLRCASQQC